MLLQRSWTSSNWVALPTPFNLAAQKSLQHCYGDPIFNGEDSAKRKAAPPQTSLAHHDTGCENKVELPVSDG